TVAPWGHRILVPWIASVLPGGPSVAFPVLTVASFALAGLLLFVFLRRLGARAWAAALGTAAFLLSPPVGELIAAPFLVEPLACALLLALLVALETELGLAALILIAILGVWAKEALVLFLPVAYLARRKSAPHAAPAAALVLVAAGAAALLLRIVWTPAITTPWRDLGPGRFRLIVASLGSEPRRWLGVLAVGGLAPLAIAGSVRPVARPYLRRYGWIFVATLAQPLLAPYAIHQVVGEMNRYLVYAAPALVPLGLAALDRVVPVFDVPVLPRPVPRALPRVAAVLAVLALVLPLAVVDRYRRLDLQG